MEGLGGIAGTFSQALGSSASRGTQGDAGLLGLEDGDEGAEDGRLPRAGAASEDADIVLQGHAEGVGLLGGELETGFFLRPSDGGLDFDGRQVALSGLDAVEGFGDLLFAAGEVGALDELVARGRGNEDFVAQEVVDAGLDDVRVGFEEFLGSGDEVGDGDAGVAIVLHFVQGVEDACVDTVGAFVGKAEVEGDFVGGEEADAVDFPGEAVGLGAEDVLGLVAVLFDEADALGRAYAVGLEEHHDVAEGALFLPGLFDLLGALGTNAGDVAEFGGKVGDDVEGVLAKVVDNFIGVDLADAVDHPGGEILPDAVDGGREFGLEFPNFKLLAKFGMLLPCALHFEGFATLDPGEFACDGDAGATVRWGNFTDAVFVFFVVEEDSLEDARQLVLLGSRHSLVCSSGLTERPVGVPMP